MVFKCFHVFLSVSDAYLSVSSVFFCMLQVLHPDVSKVDRVLHLPPYLLLPHLGVSSPPSVALHPSQTAAGASGEGTPTDGGAHASACSPLPLRGQVALRFTFSVILGDAEMGCSR